ncbi:hypothetical protein HQ602_17615 [Rhodococcus kroppenstedtii]|uniref:hypothetical protein n=1 Tax=Rhodococcoides kroppenstedtii TaxID=293050 RepID=UPI001C9B6932|nr:hypothetical protein [Rhodococcus kroppenstedtii]MBY6438194.1 hypothetical protein [Rhodococcus kroppenstedtii]
MRETVDAPVVASVRDDARDSRGGVGGADFRADAPVRTGCATVVVLDFGRTGTGVTVVGVDEDRVVDEVRWPSPSGDACDLIVLDHLRARGILGPRDGDRESPEILTFCRSVKESLSTSTAARTPASGPGGPVTLITRADFEDALRPSLEDLVDRVAVLVRDAGRVTEAVVLTGGGAAVPLVRAVVEERLAPILPEVAAAADAVPVARVVEASPESSPEPSPEPSPESEVPTAQTPEPAVDHPAAPDAAAPGAEPEPEPGPEPEPRAHAETDRRDSRSFAYSAVETAPAQDDADWDLLDDPPPGPQRRRLWTAVLVVALIIVAAGAAAWAYLGTATPMDGPDGAGPAAPPTATVATDPRGTSVAPTTAASDEDADGDGFPDSWGDDIGSRLGTAN